MEPAAATPAGADSPTEEESAAGEADDKNWWEEGWQEILAQGVGGGVACCALRSSQTSVYSWPGVGLRATGGGVGRLLLLARQY